MQPAMTAAAPLPTARPWRGLLLACLPLVLALLACEVTPPPNPHTGPEPRDRELPSFSLRIDPAVAQLANGESIRLRVDAYRDEGFLHPIALAVAPDAELPTGLAVGSLSLAAGEVSGELFVQVGAQVPHGAHELALRASADGQVKRLVVGLEVLAALPRVEQVELLGAAGSSQVRQGQGNVTLRLSGAHLDRIASAEIEGMQVALASGGAAQLDLSVTVPHGAAFGYRHLLLDAGSLGTTLLRDALEVRYITVAAGGDDGALGTADHPFRSLSRALLSAGDGDTVWLLDGRYHQAAGEDWPIMSWGAADVIEEAPAINVPEGVRIVGQSQEGVVLDGPAGYVGLVFEGSGSLERLTMTGFGAAVYADQGSLRLEQVAIVGTREGVVVNGQVELDMRDSLLQAVFHDGLRVEMNAIAALEGVRFEQNLWAASVRHGALLRMHEVSIEGSAMEGLRFFDTSHGLLDEVTISGSSFDGIAFDGTELVLRRSLLEGNGGAGLRVLGEPMTVDLGTIDEPGDNRLEGNWDVQLVDARPPRGDLEGRLITLSETTLNGQLLRDLLEVGALEVDELYAIRGLNNRIRFF